MWYSSPLPIRLHRKYSTCTFLCVLYLWYSSPHHFHRLHRKYLHVLASEADLSRTEMASDYTAALLVQLPVRKASKGQMRLRGVGVMSGVHVVSAECFQSDCSCSSRFFFYLYVSAPCIFTELRYIYKVTLQEFIVSQNLFIMQTLKCIHLYLLCLYWKSQYLYLCEDYGVIH